MPIYMHEDPPTFEQWRAREMIDSFEQVQRDSRWRRFRNWMRGRVVAYQDWARERINGVDC